MRSLLETGKFVIARCKIEHEQVRYPIYDLAEIGLVRRMRVISIPMVSQ